MSEKPPVMLRPVEVEDLNFIFSSWLKSYRDATAVRGVPNDIFYKSHHALIERLQQKACCTAVVACDPEDPAQIYAYAVGEYSGDGLVLHYVYVKFNLRGFGIARSLVESLVLPSVKWVQFSHKTHVIENMMAKLSKMNFVFNPYTLS